MAEAKAEEPPQISDVREKLEIYFGFTRLAKRYALLGACLKDLQCGTTIEAPVFSNLRRECNTLFNKTSVLISRSHNLIESFETRCRDIADDTKKILGFVEKGKIKQALNIFNSIKNIAEEMENKSEIMMEKLWSFSEDLVKAANSFDINWDAAHVKKEDLSNQLKILNSEYKKDQRKLKGLQAWLTENKEKIPEVPKQNYLQYILSHVHEVSLRGISAKFREQDCNKKWDVYERATRYYEDKEKAKQDTLEALSEHVEKKRKKMKSIDNMKYIMDVLHDTITVMGGLSATMIKATDFWNYMKEYCSKAIRVTSHSKAELEIVEPVLELAEVRLSMNKFTGFWTVFGEVCSFAKSQLKKSRDDLLKAMEERISPAEAESCLQTLAK